MLCKQSSKRDLVMFGLPILELAIGLSFVYLLLALICTTVNETIAGLTKRRASFLEKGINALFADDSELKNKLLCHPLITSLAPTKDTTPSYLPASKFALALMDILTGNGKPAYDSQALREGVSKLKQPSLQRSLSALVSDPEDASADQQKIESWFNECMDRVSGWYKRRTTLWIWILAGIITIGINADSMQISRKLWTSQAMRSAVVESAKSRAQSDRSEELLPLTVNDDPSLPKESTPVFPHSNAVLTKTEQTALSELTGWSDDARQWRENKQACSRIWQILLHVPGWFATIVAVSLGAPFWFDKLNTFMNIRSAGRAPDEPRDKAGPPQAKVVVG